MEMSASTGGPQVVFMATSAASNIYQSNKAETRNHDHWRRNSKKDRRSALETKLLLGSEVVTLA